MTSAARPRRIAVVGGTHGNEKSGVWVVRAMREHPDRFRHHGLDVLSLLANPEAETRNLRYLDRDLNRCFGPELDNTTASDPHARERGRARAIASELRDTDLLVDVHNSTAAMGLTWILTDRNPWCWWLAWKSLGDDARTRILFTPETPGTNVFLPSISRGEICLEIGPVPHGVHSHWAADAAITTVERLLARLADVAPDFDPRAALGEADFVYHLGQPSVDYPRGPDGDVRAILHRDRLGQDYMPLPDGAPLFVDPVDGTTTPWRGPTIHPVFVGESAYVEKGIAFTPTLLRSWNGGREVFP